MLQAEIGTRPALMFARRKDETMLFLFQTTSFRCQLSIDQSELRGLLRESEFHLILFGASVFLNMYNHIMEKTFTWAVFVLFMSLQAMAGQRSRTRERGVAESAEEEFRREMSQWETSLFGSIFTDERKLSGRERAHEV